jgi:Protein of unknown function (DUF1552)
MIRRISRRTVLRGLGAAIGLPWLEAMMPLVSRAAGSESKPPLRLACLFTLPNGVTISKWTPQGLGTKFTLSPILEPLQPLQKDILVLTGLENTAAVKAGGIQADVGGHNCAASSLLTGRIPAPKLHNSVSIDQLYAHKVGKATKIPSLELGVEAIGTGSTRNKDYPPTLSVAFSWTKDSCYLPIEYHPRAVFDRLFSSGDRERQRYDKSILDAVMEDSRSLKAKLGNGDERKLDEYLNSIRELEKRIQQFAEYTPPPAPKAALDPEFQKRIDHVEQSIPKGNDPFDNDKAGDFPEHVRIMLDLIVLAFQADVTRVATFMFSRELSNRVYPFLGIRGASHDLSHSGHDDFAKISRFHMSLFAEMLTKMKAIQEGDGTMLDHSLVFGGGGIGQSTGHDNFNLPIVLAGKAGGLLKTGRHLAYVKNPSRVLSGEGPSFANLLLSMTDLLGFQLPSFGDSTGRLSL